ncbi:MAG: hypothetical protein AB7O52_06060 [Planctomycetota bacterium]
MRRSRHLTLAALFLFLGAGSAAYAQNSMVLSDQTVGAGSTFSCRVLLTNVQAIAGYTCVTTFDPAIFTAAAADVSGLDIVTVMGPVAAPGQNGGIEFLTTKLMPDYSSLAVIFDLNFPFNGQSLPAGGPRSVARFSYSIVDDPLIVGQQFTIQLQNNIGTPPLSNVISLVGGISAFPTLTNSTITVVDLPSFSRGDPNSDGVSNIGDAIYTIQFLFQNGAAPNCLLSMDINGDGLRDISDVIYLVTWQFSNGPPPPQPYPGCGIDPGGGSECNFYPGC